jgi:RNA polymerase sigma factor (sigma-70 family)
LNAGVAIIGMRRRFFSLRCRGIVEFDVSDTDSMNLRVKGHEDDDRGLMLKFQAHGDEGAFNTLFSRHKAPLIGFLNRMFNNPTRAEEISQVVWVKVIETAGRAHYVADLNASFTTWLFTLARNAALDDLRKQERIEVVADVPEHRTDDENAVEALVEDGRMHTALRDAIRTLPLDQREVVAMWSAGISYEEIATVTGAPLATVIGRKRYALNRLRTMLAEAGIDAGERL